MAPSTIDRYLVKSEVGRGGMATVFQAEDPRFGRDVAIKVLPREFLHDPTFRERFEREARTVALLEHPAIVPVYDYGEDDGQPFLVMRYMTGGTLSDRIKSDGAFTLLEVSRILNRVGAALDGAHLKGLVHRDLKPGNILFDQYDEPYLSDFGIVKLAESASSLTASGAIGTPAYMSPEQAYGERDIDGRSDIYSLGVIVFEMLTGRALYEADTPMGVVIKHILDPVPDITAIKPDLPIDVERVLTKTLAKNPDDRFQKASELAAAFQSVAEGKPLSDELHSPSTIVKPKYTSELTGPPTVVAPPGLSSMPAETREKDTRPHPVPRWAYGVFGVVGVVALLFLGNALLNRPEVPGVTDDGQVVVLATSPAEVGVAPTPLPTVLQDGEGSAPLDNVDAVNAVIEVGASHTTIGATVSEAAYATRYMVPRRREPVQYSYTVTDDVGEFVFLQEDAEFFDPELDEMSELQIGLTPEVPLNLTVLARTGDLTIDLSDLQVESLYVQAESGRVTIILPGSGELDFDLRTIGADVIVSLASPDDMIELTRARVEVDGGSVNMDLPPFEAYGIDVVVGDGYARFYLDDEQQARVTLNGVPDRFLAETDRFVNGEVVGVWQTENYGTRPDQVEIDAVAWGGTLVLADYSPGTQ